MADIASIARPYAKALYELAQETASYDAWAAAVSHLAAVASDDDFSALVNDPRVEPSKITELLIDVSREHLPAGGENFVRLLVANDRLAALPDIEQQYADLVDKAQALVNAEVITAMPLSESQSAALQSALEKRLGLKVSLQETVDAALVGGAVIKAGDLVIDGSAKGRIEKLTTALLR